MTNLTDEFMERRASENPVVLTADQRAVALRELGKTALLVKAVHEHIAAGSLTDGFTAVALGLLEHQVQDLSKVTGVPCVSAAEVEQRYAELRNANNRVHELEKQLGSAGANIDIKHVVAHYSTLVREWWQRDGLGYVSEFNFGQYGSLELVLSGAVMAPGRYMSDTPETDKQTQAQWLDGLRSRGFVFHEDGGREQSLTDCAQTRDALDKLVSAMPSAKVRKIESVRGRSGEFAIRSIEVLIVQPKDVLALAVSAKEGVTGTRLI